MQLTRSVALGLSLLAPVLLSACGDDAPRDQPDADSDTGDTVDSAGSECGDDADCAAVLGAPAECQVAACVAGVCVFRPSAPTTACDDGDPCTMADACSAGVCAGATADCDDGEACTLDFCAAAIGCVHLASGGDCDDGDVCTTGDACQDGECQGLEVLGCDGDVCGDGGCTGAETCAECPADCSPIGVGACAGACDPRVTPTTCAANFACVPSAGDAGAGACLGQATACDVRSQSGCAAGETCLPLSGLGIGGSAFICAGTVGERAAGDACGEQSDCAVGLLCARGVCHATCDPALTACDAGACSDVSRFFGLAPGAVGTCGAGCGDGECAADESCQECALDCGDCDVCGDLVCGASESCSACARDCGLCDECGNTVCQDGETCLDCAADCGACALCGDGVCGASERCDDCPGDCGSCAGSCGDGTCSPLENCTSCGPSDCGACLQIACGDGVCGPALEDCGNCAADCGACATSCGDGACELGESCSSCPADCAFIGGLACSGSCDPTAPASIGGCAANHACVPTLRGRLFLAALIDGNGVCGVDCADDGDCPDGACLRLGGLEVAGLCGSSCSVQAGGCVAGATCVPRSSAPAEADLGVCVAAGVCNPFAPRGAECAAGSSCVSVAGAAELGVCMPGCSLQNASCTSGACHAKSDPSWHEGSCIGQASACDPALQAGCAAAETCMVVAGARGSAITGVARVCSGAVGSVALGASCASEACAPGLLCVDATCRKPCAPGGSGCAGGACVDESVGFGLAAATLGLCR